MATPARSDPPVDADLAVVAILEAIDSWQRDPSDSNLRAVEASVRVILRAVKLAGAALELEGTGGSGLPELRVGIGTLERHGEAPHVAGVRAIELMVDGGRRRIGRILTDAGRAGGPARSPAGEAASAVLRALELAVDAAWSRSTVRRTLEQLEALDSATRGIAGVLSVDRVLQLICDRVRELVGAEYAALGVADSGGYLERFVTSGISRTERERIGPPPRGHGLLGLIIHEGRTFRIADIAADRRRYGFPPHHPAMSSFLGVPITVKGRSVGDLYMTNKRGANEFTESDQQLAEMFAMHAGIAIENARLHEQVQRLAVVEERERIGQDLHDGIIQGIYAVALSLEDVPDMMADDPAEATGRIERAIDGLNLTIRDLRNFIFGLRPEMFEQAGLLGGLAGLAEELRLNTLIDVEVASTTTDLGLTPEEGIQLLHIAREALSNVTRHAGATRARLEVRVDRETEGDDEIGSVVTLEISDNGRGFLVSVPRGPNHQGLANMRTRATALGGTLKIESEPGVGTRIIVRLPRGRDD